ncbi:MAG: Asp-tRNA(Asn)/Glu-tRNA(Gln) amidotransferase subunit GatC [Clostridia bacterium]|nr:Asp-tRNA(Asn)/Glu-tRNA(Gln) amidotransferase subunit GatC [Clostridia bacterium]
MKISKEEVIHIAKLACLNIPEDKIENYRKNLEEILDFAQIVNKVDTEGMKETVGVNESYNVFRKDEIIDYGEAEELLKNAPSQDEGMFRIPKVIN